MDRYTVKKIPFVDCDAYAKERWFTNEYDCPKDFLDDCEGVDGSFCLIYENGKEEPWYNIMVLDADQKFVRLFDDYLVDNFNALVAFVTKNKDNPNLAEFFKELCFEEHLKERCVKIENYYYPYVLGVNRDGVTVLDFGEILEFDCFSCRNVLDKFVRACKEHLQRDFLIKVDKLEIADCGKLDDLRALKYFDDSLRILLIKVTLIGELNGIKNLKNTKNVYFLQCGLTSINQLESLTNIKRLGIPGNSINDLTPLAKLTNLRVLNFDSNVVSDLTPLIDLTKLEELSFSGNKVMFQFLKIHL